MRAEATILRRTNILLCLLSCVPSLLVSEYVGDVELDDQEESCLREWAAETDLVATLEGFESGDVGAAPSLLGVFTCAPILLFPAEMGEVVALSEDEESCLRERIDTADVATIISGNAPVEASLPAVRDCVVFVGDDHANTIEYATAIAVDEAVQASIDYVDDDDIFAFQAQEGATYRIDVELGTLEDSGLALYDADYTELDYNDDIADSLASRLLWEAPSDGEYYVAVWAYDTGSYTLTVTAVGD